MFRLNKQAAHRLTAVARAKPKMLKKSLQGKNYVQNRLAKPANEWGVGPGELTEFSMNYIKRWG